MKTIGDEMAQLEREMLARGELAPTIALRREWAATWSARIAAMLEAPAKKNATARLWRMRFFADDDYLVCTLVQQLLAPAGVPSDQAIKVAMFLTRPYTRAGLSGGPVVQMQLAGQYSVDEIVAFLRLDLLDPADESATWRDETRYSDIVVVHDIIREHGRRLN